jgi:hypothetical protein
MGGPTRESHYLAWHNSEPQVKICERQKIQVDPPRGKTGDVPRNISCRDKVPDGHYYIKAGSLHKHIIGHPIDIEGKGKENRTAKTST